jgi:hypothetical protein
MVSKHAPGWLPRACVVGALFVVSACQEGPTSILLHIEAASGIVIRNLSVEAAVAVTGKSAVGTLPAAGGAPSLPADAVVVLDDVASDVTVTLIGEDSRGLTFSATGTVMSTPHRQVDLALTLGGLSTAIGWSDVPGAQLKPVCPASTSAYDFGFLCQYVVRGNGAAADTKRNRLIMTGGGGGKYEGNELYAFDPMAQALTRLNDPSPLADSGPGCPETLSDGAPNARTTTDGLVYVAHRDALFMFGGSTPCQLSAASWSFDLGTLAWRRLDPVAGDQPAGFEWIGADYDPGSKLIYLLNSLAFYQYDYDANRYTVLDTTPSCYNMTGRLDLKRGLFVLFGSRGCAGGNGGILVYDVSAGGDHKQQNWATQVTGCDPLLDATGPGLSYDPDLGALVGWPNFGDSVYIFDPETRSCTAQTFPNGPPDSAHTAPDTSLGTYARFSYFPALGVFAVVNDWDLDAYTLRLTPP